MSCSPAARERVRRAAAELRDCDGVIGADVLAPTEGTHGRWSIEVTTTTPPSSVLLERLAAHDLAVPDVAPRGSGFRLVATV